MDSVLSGDYSFQNTKRVVDEVYRVLNKSTGCYIVVSHGFPDNRLPYLKKDKYNWNLSVHKVYKPDIVTNSLEFNAEDLNNYHFIYVCKMNKDSHMHKLIPSWLSILSYIICMYIYIIWQIDSQIYWISIHFQMHITINVVTMLKPLV